MVKEKSNEHIKPGGQSILEVIIAGFVFVVGVLSVGYLLLDAANSARQGKERLKALYLAEEGLEAARAVRNRSYLNLSNGIFGVSSASGQWIFSGSSDVTDGFSRAITISNVDSRTKLVKSKVSWPFTTNRLEEVELFTFLTDWRSAGPMSALLINVASPVVSYSNRTVTVNLTNAGPSSMTITKMVITWTYAVTMNRVRINGTTKWSSTVNSGTNITLSGGGATIAAGTTQPLEIRFSSIFFSPTTIQIKAINGSSIATSSSFYVP